MRRPSTSLVVAVIALFVAAGGTAVAASHYLITSKHQIKPSVLKNLRGSRGYRGFTGGKGPTGLNGNPGPAGIASVHDSQSSPVFYGPASSGAGAVAQATAACPAGSFVVGGAAYVSSIETSISTFAGPTSYAAVSNNASPFSGSLTATAICASGPGLTASARGPSAPSDEASQLAATLRSQHG